MKIQSLHHVQLAMPLGEEAAARDFYTGRLGLREVVKPAPLRARGGVWFEGDGIALHLGVEEPFQPARKAHVALAVDDLDAAWRALADIAHGAIEALPDWRRFYVSDPFGNRVEILQPA